MYNPRRAGQGFSNESPSPSSHNNSGQCSSTGTQARNQNFSYGCPTVTFNQEYRGTSSNDAEAARGNLPSCSSMLETQQTTMYRTLENNRNNNCDRPPVADYQHAQGVSDGSANLGNYNSSTGNSRWRRATRNEEPEAAADRNDDFMMNHENNARYQRHR